MCGLCRGVMDPVQSADVFYPSMFKPVLVDAYQNVAPTDMKKMPQLMKKVVDVAAQGIWQVEGLMGMLDIYSKLCKAAAYADYSLFESPNATLSELMQMMDAAAEHLSRTGKFDGFRVTGDGDTLFAYSACDGGSDAADDDDDRLTVVDAPPGVNLPGVGTNMSQIPIPIPMPVPAVIPQGTVNLWLNDQQPIMYERASNVVLGGNGMFVA
jgi:hypothetical protein